MLLLAVGHSHDESLTRLDARGDLNLYLLWLLLHLLHLHRLWCCVFPEEEEDELLEERKYNIKREGDTVCQC